MTVSKPKHNAKKKPKKKHSGEFLLTTDRYDIIKNHRHIVGAIRVMHKTRKKEGDDFCIFIEGWPQYVSKLKGKHIFKDMCHHSFLTYDVFHVLTCTHTILSWQIMNSGRMIKAQRFQYRTMLSSLMYVTDLRAYVALDIGERLLLLVLSKEKMELLVLMTVECLYNAMCLAFIKETKQVIVGGTGYLNKYIFLSGFENSAKLEKAGSVNCSLQKSELLRRIIVDGVAHTLVVLTENRLLMLDYRTWTEMRSMKDPESGTLTCYAVYQTNEYFITGGRSGLIKVWNPKVYTEVHCFKGHKTKIVDVRVSNARSLLFSASDDGWVFIWRMDIFKTPLQKVQVGDTMSTMGLTNEKGKRGFWCMVENAIVLYEYEMFYDDYAMMDSTVFKLERVSGYDDHPNRIMVVTEDGGMRHLNPVTASLVGYMFPMTTLRSIGDIEDVIIFAGFRNGQIQLLYSDSFVMLRPVQAHHASVEVLELVSEVVPTGEAVFQTTSFIVSAGNDCIIKLWNIQCRLDPVNGLDIKLLKLLEIRCERPPRFVCATFARICFTYRDTFILQMYKLDVGDALLRPQIILNPSFLRHTPDYDHTDTITSLVKCPLLKIFATSSKDRTIRLWDYDNELLRELIFLRPVASCCFATDIGHLLGAFHKSIVCCAPHKYLPWNILRRMASKTYWDRDERELSMPFQVSTKSWIDPSKVRELGLLKQGQRPLVNQGLHHHTVAQEEWELVWAEAEGKAVNHVNIPITMLKSHNPRWLAENRTRTTVFRPKLHRKAIELIMPHHPQVEQPHPPVAPRAEMAEALTSGGDLEFSQWSDSDISSSQISDSEFEDTRVECWEKSVGKQAVDPPMFSFLKVVKKDLGQRQEREEEIVKEKAKDAATWKKRIESKRVTAQYAALSEREEEIKKKKAKDAATCKKGLESKRSTAQNAALSEDAAELFEALDLISTLPHKFDVLRTSLTHLPNIVKEHDSVSNSPSEESEESSNEEIQEIRKQALSSPAPRQGKATLRDYMMRRGFAGTAEKEAFLEEIEANMEELERNSTIPYSHKAFLLRVGRKVHRAVIDHVGEINDVVSKAMRDAFKYSLVGRRPGIAPPPHFVEPLVEHISETEIEEKIKPPTKSTVLDLKSWRKMKKVTMYELIPSDENLLKKGNKKRKGKGKKVNRTGRKHSSAAKRMFSDVDGPGSKTSLASRRTSSRRTSSPASSMRTSPESSRRTSSVAIPVIRPEDKDDVDEALREGPDVQQLRKEGKSENKKVSKTGKKQSSAAKRMFSDVDGPGSKTLLASRRTSPASSRRRLPASSRRTLPASSRRTLPESSRGTSPAIRPEVKDDVDEAQREGPDVQQLRKLELAKLGAPTEAMKKLMKNLMDCSWFPRGVSPDMPSVFGALMELLNPSTDPDVLQQAILFTLQMMRSGELPKILQEMLTKTIAELMLEIDEGLCLSLLPELAITLNNEDLMQLMGNMVTFFDNSTSERVQRMAIRLVEMEGKKRALIENLKKLGHPTAELTEVLEQVRAQSWFPSNIPRDLPSTCLAWMSVQVPLTDPPALHEAVQFTCTTMATKVLPDALRAALEDSILDVLYFAPAETSVGLMPMAAKILTRQQLESVMQAAFLNPDCQVRGKVMQMANSLGINTKAEKWKNLRGRRWSGGKQKASTAVKVYKKTKTMLTGNIGTSQKRRKAKISFKPRMWFPTAPEGPEGKLFNEMSLFNPHSAPGRSQPPPRHSLAVPGKSDPKSSSASNSGEEKRPTVSEGLEISKKGSLLIADSDHSLPDDFCKMTGKHENEENLKTSPSTRRIFESAPVPTGKEGTLLTDHPRKSKELTLDKNVKAGSSGPLDSKVLEDEVESFDMSKITLKSDGSAETTDESILPLSSVTTDASPRPQSSLISDESPREPSTVPRIDNRTELSAVPSDASSEVLQSVSQAPSLHTSLQSVFQASSLHTSSLLRVSSQLQLLIDTVGSRSHSDDCLSGTSSLALLEDVAQSTKTSVKRFDISPKESKLPQIPRDTSVPRPQFHSSVTHVHFEIPEDPGFGSTEDCLPHVSSQGQPALLTHSEEEQTEASVNFPVTPFVSHTDVKEMPRGVLLDKRDEKPKYRIKPTRFSTPREGGRPRLTGSGMNKLLPILEVAELDTSYKRLQYLNKKYGTAKRFYIEGRDLDKLTPAVPTNKMSCIPELSLGEPSETSLRWQSSAIRIHSVDYELAKSRNKHRSVPPPIRLWEVGPPTHHMQQRVATLSQGSTSSHTHPARQPSVSHVGNKKSRRIALIAREHAREAEFLLTKLNQKQMETADMKKLEQLFSAYPKAYPEADAGDLHGDESLRTLLAIKNLLNWCQWGPGEPGLRVARAATVSHEKHPPPEHRGPIRVLKGRMGTMTADRETGQSDYGKISMEWTTQEPRIPVPGLQRQVREMEEQGLHYRTFTSRVPPTMDRNTRAVNVPFAPDQFTVTSAPKKVVKLPPLPRKHPTSLTSQVKSTKKSNQLPAVILRHSSSSWLPASLQDFVIDSFRHSGQ